MFDMFGKMDEIKRQMDEMKKKMDDITVEGESGGGAVKVIATANKKIKNIAIDEEMIAEGDKEQIEDLVTVAVNRALEQAEVIHDTEMKKMAGGMLPPGLGF